jgi:ABC-type phosphate transport system permease subunit
MFTICLILAIICVALAIFMWRAAWKFYQEYKYLKSQEGHRWAGDYYNNSKRSLEEQVLAAMFFTGMLCFFVIIIITIK